MTWLDDPVAAAVALPPLALGLFVFASAFLEYLFPPYWGDTFVLLGFFLAGQGALAPATVFAAALAGGVMGSVATYGLGWRYGMAVTRRLLPRYRHLPSGKDPLALFQQYGLKMLLLNRFLPVIRGVMFYAAGALKLPLRPVVVYGTLSNLAFFGMLMWVGLWTADSWPEIQRASRESNRLLAIVAVAAVSIWLALAWWRRQQFKVSSDNSLDDTGLLDTGSVTSTEDRIDPEASESDEGNRK